MTKKIVHVLFLGLGLMMTGHAILTPRLMIIVMMAGDLLGMSLTTDQVRPSLLPNNWRLGTLTIAGIFMGVSELAFCGSALAIGHFRLGLGIATLQTLAFLSWSVATRRPCMRCAPAPSLYPKLLRVLAAEVRTARQAFSEI